MARKFKFRVNAGQVKVDVLALRARAAGLEVVRESMDHITVLVPDAVDGWRSIGLEDQIRAALRLRTIDYPMRNPIKFLGVVVCSDAEQLSWASTRAIERAQEKKS